MVPARKHPDLSATGPILITGGDPAGIAPEILLACAADLSADIPLGSQSGANIESPAHADPAYVYFATAGDAHIEAFVRRCAKGGLRTRRSPAGAVVQSETFPFEQPGVTVVDVRAAVPGASDYEPRPGRPDATGGALAFAALRLACDLALARPCRGIVTAPLSKEWVARAGQRTFQGHTEYLAERFARDVIMLMHGVSFSVIPLTVHIPLSAVPAALRLRLRDPALRRLLGELCQFPAYAGARLAMCGLNPHCGDGGLFGTEDQEFIGDWCAGLRADGIPLDGPLAADTLFTDGIRQRYRLILSCYHDQGLIPFKAFEGHRGVNTTIGLPLIRTSPDHGTAFDIAGRGLASPDSLRAALQVVLKNEFC